MQRRPSSVWLERAHERCDSGCRADRRWRRASDGRCAAVYHWNAADSSPAPSMRQSRRDRARSHAASGSQARATTGQATTALAPRSSSQRVHEQPRVHDERCATSSCATSGTAATRSAEAHVQRSYRPGSLRRRRRSDELLRSDSDATQRWFQPRCDAPRDSPRARYDDVRPCGRRRGASVRLASAAAGPGDQHRSDTRGFNPINQLHASPVVHGSGTLKRVLRRNNRLQ